MLAALAQGRATAGYSVVPRVRGRGIASAALTALTSFAWSIPARRAFPRISMSATGGDRLPLRRTDGGYQAGWVLAANLAADLAAWCRLLGLYDQDDLKDAEPDTLRYRLLSLPARLVRHARARVLKISRTWPWKEAFLACWQRLCALPAPA